MCSAYVDAKNKMNQMRTARGFFPVVAMIGGGGGSHGKKDGRKGSGKKFKGRPKGPGPGGGKGKHMPKPGPSSPSGKARGRAALGKQLCLRCGQPGHGARNCPQSGNGEKRKRLDDDAEDINMVENVDAQVYSMDERCRCSPRIEAPGEEVQQVPVPRHQRHFALALARWRRPRPAWWCRPTWVGRNASCWSTSLVEQPPPWLDAPYWRRWASQWSTVRT